MRSAPAAESRCLEAFIEFRGRKAGRAALLKLYGIAAMRRVHF